ncbi:MAG: GNAT family N-acetyltransferase [Bacteroidota bacterium]
MTSIIRTSPRLLLRHLTMDDAEGMFAMDSDPRVLTFLDLAPQTHIDESRKTIQHVIDQYQEHGVGRLALELKETGEFIGWAGLKFMTETINDHIHYYDLGYRLLPKFWGQGYATEAAMASRDYGFEDLKAEKLYAVAMHGHWASRRVLEKTGLEVKGDCMFYGHPHWWLEISAP